MTAGKPLRVVLIKPSKYAADGSDHCYTKFYALHDTLLKSARWYWQKRHSGNQMLRLTTAGYSFIARAAAAPRQHPMAGGVDRVTMDRVADYIELRRRLYGFDLAPLPASLPLPAQARSAASDAPLRPAAGIGSATAATALSQ